MVMQNFLRQRAEELFDGGIETAKSDLTEDIEEAVSKLRKRLGERLTRVTEFTTVGEIDELIKSLERFDYGESILDLIAIKSMNGKMRPKKSDYLWELVPRLIREHGYVSGKLLTPDHPKKGAQFLRNNDYRLDLIKDVESPVNDTRYIPYYQKIMWAIDGSMSAYGMVTRHMLASDDAIINPFVAMAAVGFITEKGNMCWIEYHTTDGETFYVGVNKNRSEDYLSKMREFKRQAEETKREHQFVSLDIDQEFPPLVDRYLHSRLKGDETKTVMDYEGIEEKGMGRNPIYVIRPTIGGDTGVASATPETTPKAPPNYYVGLDGCVYTSFERAVEANKAFIEDSGRH